MAEGHRVAARGVLDGGEHNATLGQVGDHNAVGVVLMKTDIRSYPWIDVKYSHGFLDYILSLGIGRTMPTQPHLHQTHPEIAKRLKRAEGHLRSIVQMIEAGRPCVDIAQQLHAVEKAVCQAKKALIHDHLDQCLEQAVGPLDRDQRGSVDEFKTITKYL